MDREQQDKERRGKIASYFLDLSKVTYTVLVVGIIVTVLQNDSYKDISLYSGIFVGSIVVFVFAKIGNNILKK